ncbi:uncharacterized protein isoform X1 [Leptinotarsa decemlineata]|uniref:uncharacterized protein isoform X1 n=2 Tax=Leptinotarsa decemlineata TaxID=7539 RepID=UPI003D30D4BF
MEMINKAVRGRGRPRRPLAQQKKVQDTVLNNKVLRIHLQRVNLERFKSRRGKPKVTVGVGKHFLGKRRVNRVSPSTKSVKSLVHKRNSSGIDSTSKNQPNRSFKGNTPKESSKKVLSGKSSVKSRDSKQATQKKGASKNTFKIKLFPPKVPKTNPMKAAENSVYARKFNCESMNRLVKPGQRFYLKFATPKPLEQGRLGYDFHSLVADVKTLQLPGPTWKIKVIIKHNRIAALIFTNKMDPERSVSFNSDSDKYDIVIDNMPVLLLGSPETVASSTDIEVLLDIIENIEPTNPMIKYK